MFGRLRDAANSAKSAVADAAKETASSLKVAGSTLKEAAKSAAAAGAHATASAASSAAASVKGAAKEAGSSLKASKKGTSFKAAAAVAAEGGLEEAAPVSPPRTDATGATLVGPATPSAVRSHVPPPLLPSARAAASLGRCVPHAALRSAFLAAPPSSYARDAPTRVLCCTWNVNGRAPTPGLDLSPWLRPQADGAGRDAGLVAVTFQEIVPLTGVC